MSLMKNTKKALGDVIPGMGRLAFDNTVGKILYVTKLGMPSSYDSVLFVNLCHSFSHWFVFGYIITV